LWEYLTLLDNAEYRSTKEFQMALKQWTCEDIMTKDPVAATKSDTVVEVARLMRSADVGLIPIVENRISNKLVGVVTDRDLTLRVIAENMDQANTSAENVMTANPVSCLPEDSVKTLTDLMSMHQLRRIIVTDSFGRMLGIVAQADLARQLDAQSTGEVVGEISQEA
jgi:CBS domain-containing protein